MITAAKELTRTLMGTGPVIGWVLLALAGLALCLNIIALFQDLFSLAYKDWQSGIHYTVWSMWPYANWLGKILLILLAIITLPSIAAMAPILAVRIAWLPANILLDRFLLYCFNVENRHGYTLPFSQYLCNKLHEANIFYTVEQEGIRVFKKKHYKKAQEILWNIKEGPNGEAL